MTYRIGIIGGGNMGSAIARGSISANVVAAGDIMVAEIDAQRRRALERLGCRTTDNAREAADAQMIILAVKPQGFEGVAEQVSPLTTPKLVITIMAGVSSSRVRRLLGAHAGVVRAMPNTPCQIRAGITAIARGDGASAGDEQIAIEIFQSLGKTVVVDESMMDAVTAVSGSGPAYAFLLAEAMEQAALQMGIPETVSRELVTHTIAGAGQLLIRSDRTADQLRQAVTSPGGTTAAAMEVMFEAELPETIVEALMAARDRASELDQR